MAAASNGPTRLFTYDPGAGELPENVAIDRRGTKYVAFPSIGEVRAISPDNQTETTVTTFDIGSGNGVLGLEADPTGVVYACLVTFGTGDAHGIWELDRNGGRSLFAGLPTDTFPNDVLLDGHSLLVTDTIGGAIWRVGEGSATEWVSDPLLEGTGNIGFGIPLGANGIARGSDGTVYVANTEKGHLVAIPTNPDGSAGEPAVFAADPRLFAADGLAIDTRDAIYVGVIGQDTIVKVSQDGSIETLATGADGLDGPSDVTFGTARGEQTDLFVTNFALLSSMDPNVEADPSFMKLDVGVPGAPIRR